MGSGPRDGVMVGLESKGLKIGMARNIIEVTALSLGWLLGGTAVSYTHLTLPTILRV